MILVNFQHIELPPPPLTQHGLAQIIWHVQTQIEVPPILCEQ